MAETIQLIKYPCPTAREEKFLKILWVDSDYVNLQAKSLYHGVRYFVRDENIYVYPNTWYDREDARMMKCGGKVTERSLDEVRSTKFDILVLVPSPNTDTELRSWLKTLSILTIILDSNDSPHPAAIGSPLVLKRECLSGYEYPVWTIPFPMGCAYTTFVSPDGKNRNIDVSFNSTSIHHVDRQYAINVLNAMNITSCTGLCNYEEFILNLARSKIALDVRGSCYGTIRFHQAIASGAMVLQRKSELIWPHPFEDGVHIISYTDDLEKKVMYYLEHETERLEIAKAGQEHLKKYHTTKARAEYFFDILEKFL